MELDALLACGTDDEKALTDGFNKTFHLQHLCAVLFISKET